jgi:hypothetical protein
MIENENRTEIENKKKNNRECFANDDVSLLPELSKKRGKYPVGSGLFGETTVLVRVPVSLVPCLNFILKHWKTSKDEKPSINFTECEN